VLNTSLVNLRGWTGGSNGLAGIAGLPGLGGSATSASYAVVFVVFGLFVCWIGYVVEHSPFGQALRATAEDEAAAAALGRNAASLRIRALVLGAAIAGVAGGLYAAWTSFIGPSVFNTTASLGILAMLLLGGLGNTWGAVCGAVVLTVLPEALRFVGLSGPSSQLFQQLSYGIALVTMMAVRPGGLFPARLGR